MLGRRKNKVREAFILKDLNNKLSVFRENLVYFSSWLSKLPEDVSKKEFKDLDKENGNGCKELLKQFDFELLKELHLKYESEEIDNFKKELVARTILNETLKAVGETFTVNDMISNKICKPENSEKVMQLMDFLASANTLNKEGKGVSAIYTLVMPSFTEDYFSEDYRVQLEKEIKKYKKFVITTAVVGKKVDENFYKAIKNYAKRNKSLVLVIPSDIKNSSKKNKAIMELDSRLKDFRIVFKDTNGESRDLYLNNNLCLCSIKTSAKQINTLTGLARMTTVKDSSMIIAATKLFEESVPTWKGQIPNRLVTTGAITEGNYATEKYMSQRTSYLGEEDHMLGAVVVEIVDDEIFHMRQVEGASDGSFTDLGIAYHPNGTITALKDSIMVLGDIHAEKLDKELFYSIMHSLEPLGVNEVILHDLFNSTSVTHHDKGKNLDKAMKALIGKLNLKEEGLQAKRLLELTREYVDKVTIVRSNHDTHLDKYLNTTQYMEDYENLYVGHQLALAYMDGENVLKYLLEDILELDPTGINWLDQDESYIKYGVQLGEHGSTGANGSRGSLATYEKCLGNCVTAHTHSGRRIRKACCVGMVGEMDQGYNSGMSSWTRTVCLVHSNGTKQLIHYIPAGKGAYSCGLENN